MKYLILPLLCTACNSGFQSGEYIATYSAPQFEDYAEADCPPQFQDINLSERLQIDVPNITEIESQNDPNFALSEMNCQFAEMGSLAWTTTDRDRIECDKTVTADILVVHEDVEHVMSVDFQTYLEVGDFVDIEGYVQYFLDAYFLSDSEYDILQSVMDPDCSALISFGLTPAD